MKDRCKEMCLVTMGENDAHGSFYAVVHLFSPIQEPPLKTISRKVIHDFLEDCEAYEYAIYAQQVFVPVYYRSCISTSYLHTFFRALIFGINIK